MIIEGSLRNEMVDVGKKLYAKDLISGSDGNISARLSENEVLITPTRICKGTMTTESILRIDLEGNVLAGNRKPTSDLIMHLTVYRLRPEIKAVVHAHPPTATGFSVAGIALNKIILPEMVLDIGRIELTDYATPTTEQVSKVITKKIKNANALLLANHGALTVGETLTEAFRRMESLETVAKISFVAKMLGRENSLTEKQVQELYHI